MVVNNEETAALGSSLRMSLDQEETEVSIMMENKASITADDSFHSTSVLDSSRVTVNTHNSILNITEEDEDEDEDDGVNRSFLFEDITTLPHEPNTTPKTPPYRHCCEPITAARKGDLSLFDQVAERFVDSLCFPGNASSKPADESMVWEGYRRVLEYDILEMMDCGHSPDQAEIDYVWSNSNIFCARRTATPSPPRRPRRHNLRERAMRVHRIRQEQRRIPSRFSPISVLPRPVRSFDAYHQVHPSLSVNDSLVQDGYDSDPEDHSILKHLPAIKLSPIRQNQVENNCSLSNNAIVQESLNMTWNVTWHRPDISPTALKVWIERGTMIHQETVMIEPKLMWRSPHAIAEQPHGISLLNLCRITTVTANNALDRKQYPLARSDRCIVIRTSVGEEYVLEADSISSCMDMVKRWKSCVARFATLAVMEDLDTIFKEFFNL